MTNIWLDSLKGFVRITLDNGVIRLALLPEIGGINTGPGAGILLPPEVPELLIDSSSANRRTAGRQLRVAHSHPARRKARRLKSDEASRPSKR